MQYPKFTCTIVFILVGALASAVAGETKSAGSISDQPAGAAQVPARNQSEANRLSTSAMRHFDGPAGSTPREIAPVTPPAPSVRPAPPSNVRIKVQTSTPSPSATAPSRSMDPSMQPTGRSHGSVAASLDAQNFAPTLRAATSGSRTKVLGEVESRVNGSEVALGSLEKTVSDMSPAGQAQFKAAAAEAHEKARALRQSIDAARQAREEEWEAARGQVAADYHAYAAALARIDGAMGAAPASR